MPQAPALPTPGPALAQAEPYHFLAEDGPSFPGSPYTPPHPGWRTVAYGLIGLWIGITSALANAAITVNLANFAGEADTWVAELSWLPAIYVAFNACANLMLVKARAQFGVARIMRVLFIVYALVTALQWVLPGFATALVVRAVAGVTAAGMNTFGIYYLMQTVTRQKRALALAVGLGVTQLGTPLARMLPVDFLTAGGWQGQIALEFSLVTISLALTNLLPLPPVERARQFGGLDFVTLALFLPAMILLCGVLNRGRLAWWTDTPWLGTALAVAIPLLAVALVIETLRERPLLHMSWIGSVMILRFAAIALLMRLALAEQTYGAVGLLTTSGLDDDQLRVLFAWVALAMALGIAAAALTLTEQAVPFQIIVAALAVALGAWMDGHSNSLTRPAQLAWSQSLIGFGTCLFVGPALAHGFLHVMKTGAGYLVSMVVVFSLTQNLGGLAGSAALGTLQSAAARQHAAVLSERMAVGDPQVAARLQRSSAAYGAVVGDPAARGAQGAAGVGAAIAREANVLAFNDVFRVVALLALATAGIVASNVLFVAVVRPRWKAAA